mmetsp:Transcript_555/g.1302  ORF Transcript_555/g.1302 Transcript_555/m.1302 type:complete len:942 (+) Transcript_555:218-3043(+)
MSLYRYVDGKQTYYQRPRSKREHGGMVAHGYQPKSPRVRPPSKNLLSEDQRLRLQIFVEKLDAETTLEGALRFLEIANIEEFFPFQACKTLQRLAKRFGSSCSPDGRIQRVVQRCASIMEIADSVSVSRALWAAGKLSLRNATLLKAAAARVPEILADCGPITLATIWNAFGVLNYEDEICLARMADEVMQRIDECDPPEIAIVLHAAAQLDFPSRKQLFLYLLPCVKEKEGSFSARHLAVCFHATARVGFRDEGLCQLVAKRFTTGVTEVDAMALTSVVYACGLIGFLDRPFLEAVAGYISRALQPGGRGLEPQQVSNIVYTFGKLAYKPPEDQKVLKEFARYALEDFRCFKEQELDNLTYGFALLKYRDEAYLGRLCAHLSEDRRAESLDCQSLVSMAYSFGLLGYTHHPTLRSIGDCAIQKLQRFKPEEFSILVYSLGLSNFRHHDLLAALPLYIPSALPRFSTQNISNLLHGLGLVGFDRDDDFVRAIVSHLASRLPECTAQDIANPITALMRMVISDDDFLLAVAEHLTSDHVQVPVAEFTPQELANTIYGFDALQVFHQKLFEKIAAATHGRLEEFIPQEVANVIWAFRKQGFGEVSWFEEVLAKCAPHIEKETSGANAGHSLAVVWVAEDLEKPLAALHDMRHQLPSYARLERVFRHRFLGPIQSFLRTLDPPRGVPSPSVYQQDFAAWDLYQIGVSFTEETLLGTGVRRVPPPIHAMEALLEHYVGSSEASLLSLHGERLIISVLPTARWLSSFLRYRLVPSIQSGSQVLAGSLVVEPSHPKDDEEANNRRFKSGSWRCARALAPSPSPSLSSAPAPSGKACEAYEAYRPVLLSTFLGNLRHRHTEVVALDLLVELAMAALESGQWKWVGDFWEKLSGEAELFVPHTPCLSCVGVFAQLRRWCPSLQLRVAYCDWRDWRRTMREAIGRTESNG